MKTEIYLHSHTHSHFKPVNPIGKNFSECSPKNIDDQQQIMWKKINDNTQLKKE